MWKFLFFTPVLKRMVFCEDLENLLSGRGGLVFEERIVQSGQETCFFDIFLMFSGCF